MLVVGQEVLLDFINDDCGDPNRDIHEDKQHGENGADFRGNISGLDAAGVRYYDCGIEQEGEERDGEVHVGWPGAGVEGPGCARQVAGRGLQAFKVAAGAEEFVKGEGEGDECGYGEKETDGAGDEAEASDALL